MIHLLKEFSVHTIVFVAFMAFGLFLAVLGRGLQGSSVEQDPVSQQEVQGLQEPQSMTPGPTYAPLPPEQSLEGMVEDSEGKVEIFKRFADEYRAVEADEVFVIGEALRTGKDAQTVLHFPQRYKLEIGAYTEIQSLSLLPYNLTLEQVEGSIVYEVSIEEYPLTVRHHGLLLKIEKGKAEISIDTDDQVALITVDQGNVTAGLLNLDNDTRVREAKAGEEMEVDLVEREIEVEKQ